MPGWRRICCAIDFSAPSRRALAEAGALAQRLAAELFVVHVRQRSEPAADVAFAPPTRHGDGGAHPAAADELASWTAEAQRLAPGLATSIELSGSPAEEIVRFAREFGCDLIVIGTHGRSGIERLALGSIAEGVVRSAGCPVLVVRAGA